MSYSKLNLKNGDTLTAQHIAHIEGGIEAVENSATDHESRIVAVEEIASEASGVINNHESRIATLETGGGGSGGGGKLYIHRVAVHFVDPGSYAPAGTVSVTFFSSEANKITSISTLSSTLGKDNAWGEYKVLILSFNGNFWLEDNPSGQRDVVDWYINSDWDLVVNYVSAYTIPKTISDCIVRYDIIDSVNDTVTEV